MSDAPQRSAAESPHDILAAEAFAVPAPDPRLRHELVLPGDPAGIAEPHDILAAEEFAMPAPEGGGDTRSAAASAGSLIGRWLALPAAGLLVARALWRRVR